MKEAIRKLAIAAGIRFHTTGSPSVAIECVSGHTRELEKFARMIAAAEREACAKLCDIAANNSFSSSGVVWGEKLARDIRMRVGE